MMACMEENKRQLLYGKITRVLLGSVPGTVEWVPSYIDAELFTSPTTTKIDFGFRVRLDGTSAALESRFFGHFQN